MDEAESLNRAIHEEVALFPYDPNWPSMFEDERDRLLRLFPGEFLAIEHFGSTAVPGLSAKPIIDILAGVDSMSRADALMEPLCHSKYTTSMEFNASLVDRRWLMRWADGRRTHHLHIMVFGSPEWDRRRPFGTCFVPILNWPKGMRRISGCGRQNFGQIERHIRRPKQILYGRH